MDEGQFLQDVYPVDNAYGGVGLFSFDSRAHLTETSDLLTPGNITRLQASWHAHWEKEKPICIEKTPGNLIMGRFLQEVFENAYFVVIKRHPIAVSLASQKWSRTPLHNLFEHWLHCHNLFEQDKKHLRHVYELTYEDYIEYPAKYTAEMAAFIGTRPINEKTESVTDSHNKKYFERWRYLATESRFRKYYRHLVCKYEGQLRMHDYSLVTEFPTDQECAINGREDWFMTGELCCDLATVCGHVWRAAALARSRFDRRMPCIHSVARRRIKPLLDRR